MPNGRWRAKLTGVAWGAFLFRRETLLLAATFFLGAAALAAAYALRPTTLRIAVAPRDGSEPALVNAFADALARRRTDLRLRLTQYADVGDSARALEDGRADLAVVRPDVLPPRNGLTVAVLRDQALLVASPTAAKITSYGDLRGKRIAFVTPRAADLKLMRDVLAYFEVPLTAAGAGQAASVAAQFVAVTAEQAASLLAARQIDAVATVGDPAGHRAHLLVRAVERAGGGVAIAGAEDVDALVQHFPVLQDLTLPAGVFDGHPRLPAEEIHVVGTSYILMARNDLSRSTVSDLTEQLFELRPAYARVSPVANYVRAPSYEISAEATAAQVPVHPGAVDYYDREQETFIDRYGDFLYLAFFGLGGLGSVIAWVQHRLALQRREDVDVALDRLAKIVMTAGGRLGPGERASLSHEVERIAVTTIRQVRRRGGGTEAFLAVAAAVGAARAALAEAKEKGDAATATPPAKLLER